MRKSLLSSAADSARRAPAEVEAAVQIPESTKINLPPKPNSRAGLKHIGAYLDDEAVEKVAILRARLKLDNSQLVKLAIDELFAKRRAEVAFKG